jgi:hypothetical protein
MTMAMVFAFYTAIGGVFLSLVSLYRAATRSEASYFFDSTPGWIFVCSCIVVLFSVSIIICTLKLSTPANKRRIAFAICMNLVILVLTFGSTELLARLLSKQIPAGKTLLGVLLYPKEWSEFAAYYKNVIEEIAHGSSYEVYDPMLGWTVAASRRDRTGFYLSSTEGLRSPRVGMSFSDLRTRHSAVSETPASIRIALIGDSMTYGHEVRCEESWGHALEAQFQPHTQVLNFAIGAQGLNQTLLRYEKDVRPMKPRIVIIGVTSAMIKRNNNIYPFLKDPEWGMPFARPRFVLRNDDVAAIRIPVPDAKEIFSTLSLTELPDLLMDDFYLPYQWERGGVWYLLEKSYLFRLAYSLRPPSDDFAAERNMKAVEVSNIVTQRLVREVIQDGAVPLVVYLPYKDEIALSEKSEAMDLPLSARMLRNAGIEYFDPTACLMAMKISDAYMPESHYSPQASAQIARCLTPVIQKILGGT